LVILGGPCFSSSMDLSIKGWERDGCSIWLDLVLFLGSAWNHLLPTHFSYEKRHLSDPEAKPESGFGGGAMLMAIAGFLPSLPLPLQQSVGFN
jgi:hypothetical protein